MYRKIRRRVLRFLEARATAAYAFIARSRPARWVCNRRSVRFVVRVLLLLWYLFINCIWRPVKKLVRRVRKFLGRHEVFPWLLTWAVCAGLGMAILQSMFAVRLAAGALAAIAFMLISFRLPLAGFLMWLLLSPLLNQLIRFKFLPGTPVITGDRVCLFILLAVFLAQARRGLKHERNTLLHLSMFAFVATMLIATIPSAKPKWSAQSVLDAYMVPVLAYFLARAWVTNRRNLSLLFNIIVLVGVYFAVCAIPEHFLGRGLFKTAAWVEEELGTVRVQGPAGTPTEFGIVVAAAVMLAITKFSGELRWSRRFLYAALTGLMLFGISLTLRRGVYVGVLAAFPVMLLASKGIRRTIAIMLAIGGLALLVSWQSLIHSKVYSVRLSDPGPIYSRAAIQATAWNMIKHHPLSGVGVGNFSAVAPKFYMPFRDISAFHGRGIASPHNQFLLVMLEGGMLAFVPFMFMILFIVLTSVRAYKAAEGPGLLGRDGVVVFWALTVAYLIQSVQGDGFWFCPYLTVLWYVFIGAMAGVHLLEREDQQMARACPNRVTYLHGGQAGQQTAG